MPTADGNDKSAGRADEPEPKLRLLVEGPTDAVVQASLDQLTAAAREDLEVL